MRNGTEVVFRVLKIEFLGFGRGMLRLRRGFGLQVVWCAKDGFCAVPRGAVFFIEIGSFCGLRLRRQSLAVWLSNRKWKKVEAQEVKISGRRA